MPPAAPNRMHGSLLPETERLDRCRYHHRVRSSRPAAQVIRHNGAQTTDQSLRYRTFAGDKFRPLDEAFITSFNAEAAQQILDGIEMPYTPLPARPIQRRLGSPPPFPWSKQAESFRVATEDSADSLPTPPPSDKSEKGYDDDAWPPPRGPSPERW